MSDKTVKLPQNRLQKEFSNFNREKPQEIISIELVNDSFKEWNVAFQMPDNTLYTGEIYILNFKFPINYPYEAPIVVFRDHVPVHPHIYSNGHICLSILSDDWSPALTTEAVTWSIISMLSSCKEKHRPEDDLRYVNTCSNNPKETRWMYHDDKV